MRPARSSSRLRLRGRGVGQASAQRSPLLGQHPHRARGQLKAIGESRTRTVPVPGECSAPELRWRWWTRRDSNPHISRVRAGCASIALRALRGDRRESNPHSGSHRPVRFPYATTTVSCCLCGPPGRNRTVIDRLSGGCTSLVLRAEKLSRGGRDRTCDLTVPNRARCRCATPRGNCCGGEQGSRTPRSGWTTRLAGGHLAPMQDGLSVGGRRGSRTLKAHRSSVFETVAIARWLALPAKNASGSRTLSLSRGCGTIACPHSGSGGNRTHVLRFKRPVQRQRLLPTRGPTPRNRTETFRFSGGRADQLRQQWD